MSSEAKETTKQMSSLKAIAEQAVAQANLFPSSKKLSEENDALRSKHGLQLIICNSVNKYNSINKDGMARDSRKLCY